MKSIPQNLLIIFAKPPVAGHAKTRLIPALGEKGAADLHARLIRHTLECTINPQEWQTQLWAASSVDNKYFMELGTQHKISVHQQRGGNLGERMYHALSQSLSRFNKVVLIGTDCPTMDKASIVKAINSLDKHEVVINPAEDGGYVLIAARKILPVVFNNVEWGSGKVMQKTQENLNLSGLLWVLGALHWDVDTPQDLTRLALENYAFAMDLPAV